MSTPERETKKPVPPLILGSKPKPKYLSFLGYFYFPALFLFLLFFISYLLGVGSANLGKDFEIDWKKVEQTVMDVIKMINPEKVSIKTSRGTMQVSQSELLNSLRSNRPDRRSWAAWWLRKFPDEKSVKALIRSSKDKSPKVRATSVDSLGLIRTPKAYPVFIKGLSDSSVQVRAFSVTGLGDLRDKRAVPLLVQQLQAEPTNEGEIISRILDSLGKIGDPQTAPIVRSYIDNQDQSIQRYARGALKKLEKNRSP